MIDEYSFDLSEIDVLKLTNVNHDGVTLSRDDLQLYITINATGQRINDRDHFWSGARGVDQIVFADGVVWDRAAIAQNAPITGTNAAETINGTSDADILDGLGGNDTLQGNNGSDTYLHRAGSGNDLIYDFGSSGDTDTLRLIGVGASNVSLTRSGYDVIVQRGDTGEAITVQYQYLSPSYGIERVLFDDGTSWDRSYVMANAAIRGTSAAETLNGTGDADTLDGLGGNDTLNGNGGSDTYLHRAGSRERPHL